MSVTADHITKAIIDLQLSDRAVCIHASLRSFGMVDGGADTIVSAFIRQGCTVLVPSFSSVFEVPPPEHERIERNGFDQEASRDLRLTEDSPVFTSASNELDVWLGVIPRTVVHMSGRSRGNHPLNSFAAVGPLAEQLVGGQRPDDVYAPLRALVGLGGKVILMGVGLQRLTLLHVAEQMAGRQLFRRWARGADGAVIATEVGSCSEGFHKLDEVVAGCGERTTVGPSVWHVLDAAAVLKAAWPAIHSDQSITHCGDADCARCNDAVLGGPILP